MKSLHDKTHHKMIIIIIIIIMIGTDAHHERSTPLFQRLSVLIQRCDTVTVLDTLTHTTPQDKM